MSFTGLDLASAIMRQRIEEDEDYVPKSAVVGMEAEILELRARLVQVEKAHKEQCVLSAELLQKQHLLKAVALCAARYAKAQSARYQRELLEAIDAYDRTP